MNKRIKKLAEQAGFDAVSMVAFDIEQDLEKFAELIVQECIEVIKPCNCGCASKTEVVLTECIIVEIKEHFGVEE